MIVNSRYRGFGAISTHQAGVNCSATGSWETWCDCMFPEGSDRSNCKKKVSWSCPGCAVAPWTDIGAAARGIPKAGALAALARLAVPMATQAIPGAVPSTPPQVGPPSAPPYVGPPLPAYLPPEIAPYVAAVRKNWLPIAIGAGALGLGVMAVLELRRGKR